MPLVELDWTGERSLVVRGTGTATRVVAHAELSESQVRTACSALGDEGAAVLDAWRQAVGLSPAS